MLRGEGVDVLRATLAEACAVTPAGLRERDEAGSSLPTSFFGPPAHVAYDGTHVLLDVARHTRQVFLLRKHLIAGGEPDFEPFA